MWQTTRQAAIVWAVVVGAGATGAAATGGEIRLSDQTLYFVDEIEVSPLDAGTIAEVAVAPGDEVSAGDVLVGLDDGQAVLERDAAKAQLAIAAADAENDAGVELARSAENLARVEYERGRALGAVIVASELDRLYFDWQKAMYQTKQAEHERRRAELNASIRRAELAAAQQAVERRRIRAPVAARVLEIRRSPGEWLTLGDAVVVLADLSTLRVKAHLLAADVRPADVRGRTGEFVVRDSGGVAATAPGVVSFVRPEIDQRGEFEVWFDVQNSRVRGDWLLTPGVRGDVVIGN